MVIVFNAMMCALALVLLKEEQHMVDKNLPIRNDAMYMSAHMFADTVQIHDY